jgi:cytochrome c556
VSPQLGDRTLNLLATVSEWRAANRKKIEERQAKSKAELDKIKAQAQTDRDAFYEQRNKTIEACKKSNRCTPQSLLPRALPAYPQ